MNDAQRLLDGDLTADELNTLLNQLESSPSFRDEVSTQQLIRDSLGGLQTPDDGYSLRILARLRQMQQGPR